MSIGDCERELRLENKTITSRLHLYVEAHKCKPPFEVRLRPYQTGKCVHNGYMQFRSELGKSNRRLGCAYHTRTTSIVNINMLWSSHMEASLYDNVQL